MATHIVYKYNIYRTTKTTVDMMVNNRPAAGPIIISHRHRHRYHNCHHHRHSAAA